MIMTPRPDIRVGPVGAGLGGSMTVLVLIGVGLLVEGPLASLAAGGSGGADGGPPNDDCINAIVGLEGDPPIAFSNVGATTDGPPDCSTNRDIWYRYQALNDKLVTVSLCDSSYDTHLSVYDGGVCPPSVLLECNDNSPDCFPPTRSELTFVSAAGGEYLIRVGGFGSQTGAGTLEITAVALPGINDECIQAIEIFDGETPFNTTGSTDSSPGLPEACAAENGTLNFGFDIWFTYVATCSGTLTVNQCDVDYDGRMAVYRNHNCPPSDDELAGCNDDACGAASGAIVSVSVECGELLTFRVGGWDAAGSGVLLITCDGGPCEDPCPWDVDDSGGVGILDLLALLAAWGSDPGGPPDFDGDGTVGILDLLTLLANWGACA